MEKGAYTLNGFKIAEFSPEGFKLVWHDKTKAKFDSKTCFNMGFFTLYKEKGSFFTIPIGNVCLDDTGIEELPKGYILDWTNGIGVRKGKIILNCRQNAVKRFSQKDVSTLVIDSDNNVGIFEIRRVPIMCKYAVSGVPVIRNGSAVDYEAFVKTQGWTDYEVRSAYRNFIGIRSGRMFLISGETKTTNYISTNEMAKKLEELKLDDLLGFDGGGSYFCTIDNERIADNDNCLVNNVGVISS